jgi:uncharacterized protein (TIGR02569 family)
VSPLLTAPSPEVLEAFRVDEQNPLPLNGGQRTAWRAGSVVFKPLDANPNILAWVETISRELDGRSDFRVAPPLRSSSGELAVDGWTAWRFEPGEPISRSWGGSVSWRDVIAAGEVFHRALTDYPRPSVLDERQDRWSFADRIAWGDGRPWGLALGHRPADTDLLFKVMERLQPIDAQSQLIHGDLAGNVLFVNGQPPCIIDFSPYWRPANAAIAIVVIDAMTFHHPGPSLIDSQLYRPDFGQYLLRALLFRVAADDDTDPRRDEAYRKTFQTVVRLLANSTNEVRP